MASFCIFARILSIVYHIPHAVATDKPARLPKEK